jgi:uncharacterized protein (TIGR03083 family)
VGHIAELYFAGRHGLLDLAATLTDADAATKVPATPAWTVKDVYAHLAGTVADALGGRMEGVATEPWTARQVADRADRTLTEICAEWAELGPELEEAMRAFPEIANPRLVIDQWTHEQDLRGALGRPGARTDGRMTFCVDTLLTGFSRAWRETDLPFVVVTGDSGEWYLGDGVVKVRLAAPDFELGRALVGRRSRAQVLAMRWSAIDEELVGPVVDHLHAFPYVLEDLLE